MYKPQAGKQTQFLESDADIVIYGGAVGGGKTYGLILCGLQLYFEGLKKPRTNCDCLTIRNRQIEMNKAGSVWKQATAIMEDLGYRAYQKPTEFRVARNSKWQFASLNSGKGARAYMGTQFACVLIDELTELDENDFWILVSRTRSATAGVKPYIRATCNPAPNWVRDLLWYWIDTKGINGEPPTYLPIPEREGEKLYIVSFKECKYYFKCYNEAWAWIKKKVRAEEPNKKEVEIQKPLSLTFISATLNDNQELLKHDPTYLSKLSFTDNNKAYQEGCWAFNSPGKLFKLEWFNLFAIEPADFDAKIITTDTACKTKTHNDYTVFQVWGLKGNKIYLIHQLRERFRIKLQMTLINHLVRHYKPQYIVIEAAAAGFQMLEEMEDLNVMVHEVKRTKDKYFRAKQVQGYVEKGYVYINNQADYYLDFVSEVIAFSPENKNKQSQHDDQVDCFVDAVQTLLVDKIVFSKNIIALKEVKIN